MSHQSYFTLPESFLEDLIQRGLDALPALVQTLLNTVMLAERQEYLQAAPYQRTPDRRDYANGFKPKTLKTRLGPIELRVPQVRKGPFYPSVLTKGQRSERAMMLALAEMYVLGVATRKVAVLVEKILGVKIGGGQERRKRYPPASLRLPFGSHTSTKPKPWLFFAPRPASRAMRK